MANSAKKAAPQRRLFQPMAISVFSFGAQRKRGILDPFSNRGFKMRQYLSRFALSPFRKLFLCGIVLTMAGGAMTLPSAAPAQSGFPGLQAIDSLAIRYQNAGKTLHLRHLSADCRSLLKQAGKMVEVSVIEDPSYGVAVDYDGHFEPEAKQA